MKIKLDENLPVALVPALERLGHDVDTVPSESLAGAGDDLIWNAAQGAGRFLITQDLDFSDITKFSPGTHQGILLLRLRDPGRLTLFKRVSNIFENEDVDSWHRCFVVATDHKIRVRCL